MYAQVAEAISRGSKQENNIGDPLFHRVGIKFDNISAGKLYPGIFGIKKIQGLRQKEVTSHL
jgi:hypothetical protein